MELKETGTTCREGFLIYSLTFGDKRKDGDEKDMLIDNHHLSSPTSSMAGFRPASAFVSY